jgi:hypothetical protein
MSDELQVQSDSLAACLRNLRSVAEQLRGSLAALDELKGPK